MTALSCLLHLVTPGLRSVTFGAASSQLGLQESPCSLPLTPAQTKGVSWREEESLLISAPEESLNGCRAYSRQERGSLNILVLLGTCQQLPLNKNQRTEQAWAEVL